MHVQLLQRSEIDSEAWDKLNRNSANCRTCMDSGYLDAICNHWSALAVMDKEVMVCAVPLNLEVKLGIQFVLQPSFAQYFNILFNASLFEVAQLEEAGVMLERELRKSADLFIYRMGNRPMAGETGSFKGFRVQKLHSYELDLQGPWEQIYTGFSTSITNHKTKAEKHGIYVVKGDDLDAFISQCKAQSYFQAKEFLVLKRLWNYLQKSGQLLILNAMDMQGHVHATGMFCIGANRMTFLVSVVHKKYRHIGSNSLLICKAIQMANKMHLDVFDFEGSMLLGPEKYYLGFRPRRVEYLQIVAGSAILYYLRKGVKWVWKAKLPQRRMAET